MPSKKKAGRELPAGAAVWCLLGFDAVKLALYLPNFRDKVTVQELEDLTSLAESLDFDSVWTLDRIVVPEEIGRASCRERV